MSPLFALAILDQVDPPGALVELADGELVEVDAHCLPATPREGEVLRIRLRSSRRCPLAFRRPLSTRTEGGALHHPWSER